MYAAVRHLLQMGLMVSVCILVPPAAVLKLERLATACNFACMPLKIFPSLLMRWAALEGLWNSTRAGRFTM